MSASQLISQSALDACEKKSADFRKLIVDDYSEAKKQLRDKLIAEVAYCLCCEIESVASRLHSKHAEKLVMKSYLSRSRLLDESTIDAILDAAKAHLQVAFDDC